MKRKKIDFKKEIPFIRRRCPHLKGKELKAAEQRFREYARICRDIYTRSEQEDGNVSNFDNNISHFYNKNKGGVRGEQSNI